MKVPHFWAEGRAKDDEGAFFMCWRWSDVSLEDARNSAVAAAKRILENFKAGQKPKRYFYGEQPLREEILEEFTGSDGSQRAVITRNSYGCRVLNTADVMFVDLDLPPTGVLENLAYFVRRLFNKNVKSPRDKKEELAFVVLEQFCDDNREWCFRVYRTFAGLRCMATHSSIDPNSPNTTMILERLGTDPLYTRLCTAQKCFRARLTPKPWRCGHTPNRIRYPYRTENKQSQFETWKTRYESRADRFATCRFLRTVGPDRVHSSVQDIMRIHDEMTRCESDLALA
jgi:hypothetical protein